MDKEVDHRQELMNTAKAMTELSVDEMAEYLLERRILWTQVQNEIRELRSALKEACTIIKSVAPELRFTSKNIDRLIN